MEDNIGPAPIQVAPRAPSGPALDFSKAEQIPGQILSIQVVNEYRKYAGDLLDANPTFGFVKELEIIKANPLPQVDQGKNIELLKLNDYIRDVNNAARIGDQKSFEKAAKILLIFLG